MIHGSFAPKLIANEVYLTNAVRAGIRGDGVSRGGRRGENEGRGEGEEGGEVYFTKLKRCKSR